MDKIHILVVDDDPAICRLLGSNLRPRGYEVTIATNGEQALGVVESQTINLIVLDIMLPRMDGIQVCQRIREWSRVPIIMLSACGDVSDKVTCLELGADDYLTKPFAIGELMARVKNALRHVPLTLETVPAREFAHGDLKINFANRRVTLRGNQVKLTPMEYTLLQTLASNSDKVLTHRILLQRVWGETYSSEKEYLRVFVGRLRKKIELDPDKPRYILTAPGVGYSFNTLACPTGREC